MDETALTQGFSGTPGASCNGHMNKMSSRLYIHRNTSAYRLDKPGRIRGIPLKDPENLLLLNLVFLFRRLLEAEEGELSGNYLLILDYRSRYRTS